MAEINEGRLVIVIRYCRNGELDVDEWALPNKYGLRLMSGELPGQEYGGVQEYGGRCGQWSGLRLMEYPGGAALWQDGRVVMEKQAMVVCCSSRMTITCCFSPGALPNLRILG